MKVIYLLMHVWSDFETHYDTIGVYEARDLAERAEEDYRNSYLRDPDDELYIEESLLNCFVGEKEKEK